MINFHVQLNDGSNPASPAAGLDINVAPVYLAGYSGSGVKLIIIDDALDSEHDDIKPNIDLSLTDDIVDAERTGPRGTDGKMPEKDNHGTRCASLAGAVANNSKCAYGIAHNVTIGGIRLVHGTVTSIMTAEAIVRFAHLAQVISSSWGPTDSGKLMIPVNSHVDRALRYAVTMGNHGLGAAVFFPAGNGGMQFDHCGADSYVNHPATIAVTSVGHIGLPPYYTEKCPAISVTVPSGGYADSEPDFVVKGTDMSALPVAAINNECREDFYGTSAAVPIAAGAVALAYEAKSDQIYAGQTTKFKFNIPEAKGRFETRNGRKGHCFVDSLEIVTVHMQWVHTNRGHLRVTLVSPGGMIVDLLGPRKLDHFSGSSEISWKSLMNFGEAGSGEWHVLITDTKISTKKHDQTGCVWYIRLELHGTESGKDCFSKNREIILPMWTQLQENARNLTKSHKLNAEEIADIYNRQRWNALKMELPQKDTR
ncbi:unnamed protein product [Schistocephalus solidus]|uniref:P/Homo B domain-containing protein n=1 Tax=Schistocephalus solidus TaxID=70667 RepID=A0A183SQV3_SCHSO|nr:unnamed protein product [Schistocephalus solidus]